MTLDSDWHTCPTICGDVKHWKTLLRQWVRPEGQPWDLIWASPDCRLLSQANTSGADIQPALDNAKAVLECIETLGPTAWVMENPAGGPRALHNQSCMAPWEAYRQRTSYCWYGALYKKSTSIWTNITCSLRAPCTTGDLCPVLQAYGHHPYTAQHGPSGNGKQLGMGSGKNVEGYPTLLVHAILGDHLPRTPTLFSMRMSPARASSPPALSEEDQVTEDDTSDGPSTMDVTPLIQEIKRALNKDRIYRHLRHKQGPLIDAAGGEEGQDTPDDSVRSAWEERFVLREGLIRLRGDNRLYVPQDKVLIDTLVNEAHRTGHFGQSKTFAVVSKVLWWPTMRRDIVTRIAGCQECQAAKTRRERVGGELQPLPPARRPWSSVSVDWVSGLPTVQRRTNNLGVDNMWTIHTTEERRDSEVNSILVLTCRYSKAVRLRACHKATSGEHVVEWFKEDLYRTFGWPDELISDNDVRFSKAYKGYMAVHGVELHFTSGMHPAANGQAERSNSTVCNVLRCLANGVPEQWPAWLPDVEFAINSTPSVHGETPFSLFLQFPPRNPLETALGVPAAGPITLDSPIHALVQGRMVEERARQEAYFNRRHPPLQFSAGDTVYLRRSAIGVGRAIGDNGPGRGTKLRNPFLGPYRVLRRKRHCNTYVLEMPSGTGIGNVWHVSHLVAGRPAGSAYDTPEFLQNPVALLASRRDLYGSVRYLTVWNSEGEHSWELPEHLSEHAQGRTLLSAFKRKNGRIVPSTNENDPWLQMHPEWLLEVVA